MEMAETTNPSLNLDYDHDRGKLQRSDTTASWYRAVTADVTPPLLKPVLENSINLSSAQSEDYYEGHDASSSTAVSLSHRSISPQPVNNERESTSASASPSASEDEKEQILAQATKPDGIEAGTRKLRRTPPSRRIKSRITLNEAGEATDKTSPLNQSQSNESEMAPVARGSWRRGGYPLQLATNASMEHMPSPKSLEVDSESVLAKTSGRTHEQQNTSPAADREHQQQKPLDEPSTLPAALPSSPPLSESEQDTARDVASVKREASGKSEKKRSPWNRRTYPLQAPASSANLRHAATPPTSESESENVHEKTRSMPHERSKPEAGHKTWHRRVYPLQAPASIQNLRQLPTPPSSAKMPDNTYDVSEDEFQEAKEDLPTSNTWRRRQYPLGASAGHANVKHEPTNSSSAKVIPKDTDEGNSDEVPTDGQRESVSKPWIRVAYPLQASTSDTDSQHVTANPSSSPEPLKQEPESTNSKPSKLNTDSQVPQKKNAFSRSVYPLQAPASISNMKQAEPTAHVSTKEESPKPQEELATKEARDKKIAEEVIAAWRRQTYPVQSPKYELHHPFDGIDEIANKVDSGPLLLPKTVRAVKSTEEAPRKGRTIVVCLDGTGDKFDNDNSNIVHLVSALKKSDPQQVTYYQAGIGTYGEGGLSGGIAAATDMAVGSGLGLHVRDAYHFLMHTYKEHDRICIFGFSRGAYTARCLAGMVHKVGLLPPRNIQQIPFAYEFYKKDTDEGWRESADFKKTFCVNINIHFIGCFDSVASVGFIPRQLPLSSTPGSKARHFRHAMALDERRAKFKVCRYQAKKWDEIENKKSEKESVTESRGFRIFKYLPFTNLAYQADKPPAYASVAEIPKHSHTGITDEEYHHLTRHEAPFDTDVLEVWFAGAHADVGGGAVPNLERHKLAQIPLRWMIRQAFECNTGIIFKTDVLAEFGLDVHTLWPTYHQLSVPTQAPPPSLLEKYGEDLPPRHVRRSKLKPIKEQEKGQEKGQDLYHLSDPTDDDWTPELVEDYYDAMTTVNDQLIQAPTWWILEIMPVEYKVPIAPGEVALRVGPNLGQYRGVEDVAPNIHWTAMHRMRQTNYKIGVRTAKNVKWNTVT